MTHLGTAVVFKVTSIWLPVQVLPPPQLPEPTQIEGLLLISYRLSPPADNLFSGEREGGSAGSTPLSQVHGCCIQRKGPRGMRWSLRGSPGLALICRMFCLRPYHSSSHWLCFWASSCLRMSLKAVEILLGIDPNPLLSLPSLPSLSPDKGPLCKQH